MRFVWPLLLLVIGCTSVTEDDAPLTTPDETVGAYVLGSVVITPDGRTTYFQVLEDLDPEAPITNANAVEAAGNGVLLSRGRNIFLGLAEAPEWVRYTAAEDGTLSETGRLSLAGEGFVGIDYGNTIVDDNLAVSVSGQLAVVWDPQEMVILRTIDLPHQQRDGYQVEVWTTIAEGGRVYVPARFSDWDGGRIHPSVVTTVLDPREGTIVGIAEDDRCASGGRVAFADGYGYVMGDGRTYSAKMFENAGGAPAPDSCLLRMAPGETSFEEDFHITIPSLTGGYEVATELESPVSGEAFAWMFYPDELPEGVEPIDFDFWGYPAFKLWQISLGDEPTAREVEGMPFGIIGFGGAPVDDKLYTGLGDTERSIVYEIDPATGTAIERFEMAGYFYGLAQLE